MVGAGDADVASAVIRGAVAAAAGGGHVHVEGAVAVHHFGRPVVAGRPRRCVDVVEDDAASAPGSKVHGLVHRNAGTTGVVQVPAATFVTQHERVAMVNATEGEHRSAGRSATDTTTRTGHVCTTTATEPASHQPVRRRDR